MKIFGTILAVLLLLVVLLGAGLQIFLTKGLTSALNSGVFPAVKSMYGLDMSITNASVNLLKGTASLDGFTVRNLKGYEEPYLLTFDRCRLELEMMSLLKRDPVVIKLAEADGAVLVVEQNSERKFNVKELADALKPVESAEPETTGQPAPAPEEKPAAEPVPVHIRRIAADVLLKYADSKLDQEYDLALRLTGTDLFTVPQESNPDSLIVLRGALAHDENSFVTDLNAIVEPLTDPKTPSFNASGSILDIDAKFLDHFLDKNDMSSSSFSVKPSIDCNAGALAGSKIDLVLNNLTLYGTDIGDTTLELPLRGTLLRPSLDVTGAVRALFSKQAEKIGKTVALRELQKEFGLGTNAAPRDVLLEGLSNNVNEIAESPALQELIKQVVPGRTNSTATTNKPLGEAVGDALSEQLGDSVKELEGNEAVRDSLRNLGKSLFGN